MELQKFLQNNLETTIHFEYFSDFASHYLKEMKSGIALSPQGTLYSKSTIRQYKAIIENFLKFEAILGRKVLTSEMTIQLFTMFERYLISTNLQKNSVGLYISKLKAILSIGFKRGVFFWNGSGATVKKELTTKVKLTLDELRKIRNQELDKEEKRCVDVFTMLFFTGMRHSTLCKFLKSPIAYIKHEEGQSFIQITADKNDGEQCIPISTAVDKILREYDYKLTSPQSHIINAHLKRVSKRAGITQPIAVRRTVSDKLIEEIIPKCDMITTHTAKRSFVTYFSLKGVDTVKLQAMTGNKDARQLAEYNRSSKLEQVVELSNHEFFKTEI